MTDIVELQPTMADLIKRVSDVNPIKVGEQIAGKVIYIAKNEVIMDIENIGLGIVRGKELYNEEFLSRIKLEEHIEAMVIDLDNELGYLELSFRAIGHDKIWSEIQTAFENQTTIECKVRDANRGGFLVKVHGIDGFLPASLLSPAHAIKQVGVEDKSLINQMKKYVGQVFQIKIASVNPDNDTMIVSEKSVSDEIAKAKLSKYKVNDIVDGSVVGVVDFGLFVRFDSDLEGLVHISEIAWKKVDDPRQYYKIGDQVKVKIVDIDKENRINLSIKQLLSNPWHDFAKKTKPGDEFTGRISKIVSYGAIVVGENDIQGLCHISQISKDQLESPAKIYDILKIGDTVKFTVLELDNEEKLYLTLLSFDNAKEIQQHYSQKETEPTSENSNTSKEAVM